MVRRKQLRYHWVTSAQVLAVSRTTREGDSKYRFQFKNRRIRQHFKILLQLVMHILTLYFLTT